MKKIIAILAIISLVSCKKETLSTTTSENVFVRVESVSKTGQSTYSDVQVVRMK